LKCSIREQFSFGRCERIGGRTKSGGPAEATGPPRELLDYCEQLPPPDASLTELTRNEGMLLVLALPDMLPPADDPLVEPVAEPPVEPPVEPVAEPPVEPVAEPPVEPVVEPVAEPPVEPLVELPLPMLPLLFAIVPVTSTRLPTRLLSSDVLPERR
jgi:hypothetical protein